MKIEVNKEKKAQKVKTIQINYPAPYYHQSWSDDADMKKKRLPKKLISPYKSVNEVSVARHSHICPNNPILTLEKTAKKLEKSLELAEKGKDKPESPKPRQPSPPHLKYGMFRKSPRMRGQTQVNVDRKRNRTVVSPTSTGPVVLPRASPTPRLAVSDIVHLDIKPKRISQY